MRRWWNTLGLVILSLLGLAVAHSPAFALFPPPEMEGAPNQPPPKESPFSMKDEGTPNAFGDLLGVRVRRQSGGMLRNILPGILVRKPSPGRPAEFPNPAQASTEDASPFTVQEGGMPNGFTELTDPRPRLGLFRGRRLLFTELLTGPQAVDPYRLAARFEYLNWRISSAGSSVDLVTTTNDFPVGGGGLGEPGTSIVVPAGDSTIDYGRMTGGRATLGIAIGYIPPLEISGFSFIRTANVFQGGAGDGLLLARPVQFADAPIIGGVGQEGVAFVNVPGFASGNLTIDSRLSFWGVEANFLFNFINADQFKVDAIVGYRHADLYESLDITHRFDGFFGQPLFGGQILFPVGASTTSFDNFRSRNAFDGGQIGLRAALSAARWSLLSDIKLAMGNTRQVLAIDGNTTLNQASGTRTSQVLSGGLLALRSNIGQRSANEFSVIPEGNLTLSFQLHPSIRLFGGYNILYWNNVIRPGDHLNSVVDSRQVPTSFFYNPGINGISPAFPSLVSRGFWAHGVNIGIEFGF